MDPRDEIKKRMKDLGISTTALAEMTGLSRSYLARWLTGDRDSIGSLNVGKVFYALGYKRAEWLKGPRLA